MEKINKYLILGAIGSALTLSSPTFAKESIVLPKDNVSLDYTYFDSDKKTGSRIGLEGMFVTDIGAFNFGIAETIGKQRIIATDENPVVNSDTLRDTFNKEKGTVEELKLGYKAKKQFGSIELGFGAGLGFGQGSTNIGLDRIGAQSEDVFKYGLGFVVQDVNSELSSSFKFGIENIIKEANYGTSNSDEEITTKDFSGSITIPIGENVLLSPIYEQQEVSSDLKFTNVAFGSLAIPREIESKSKMPGLEGVLIINGVRYLASYQEKQGRVSHEFTAPKNSGYRIRLGVENEGSIYSIQIDKDKSSSLSLMPSFDPISGIPIILNFNERHNNESITLGYENDSLNLKISYDKVNVLGSTDAVVPLLGNVVIPVNQGSQKYETYSAQGEKKFDSFGVQGRIAYEKVHHGFEAMIGLIKRF